MDFYPSKNNDALNRQPYQPDVVTGRAMVNWLYPVSVCWDALTICDSGAFQTIAPEDRMLPGQALDGQLQSEEQQRWRNGGFSYNEGYHYEAIVHYDQPLGVDEAIEGGKKVKRRGTRETAAAAVEETLRNAHYYHGRRDEVQGAIAYAAQGAEPDQYLACAAELLTLRRPQDWIAMGGFCIIGRMPNKALHLDGRKEPTTLMRLFAETLDRLVPLCKSGGVPRIHILGVCYPPAIRLAREYERRHAIRFSTDSAAPEMAGIMGRTYVDGHQRKAFTKEQKYQAYHPCAQALANVEEYSRWTANL